MSAAISVSPGNNLTGLSPDDRQPNDWLRMVARVFAAYRMTPLEQSIVAYIDGFKLSIEKPSSTVDPIAVIGITDGQAFVDDQFIGFTDGPLDPESTITLDVSGLQTGNPDRDIIDPGTAYAVVLCYTWVNIMPPQRPNFDIVQQDKIDPEHMLELGQIYINAAGEITLVDDKRPWFWELIQLFIGDTEIDGPTNKRGDDNKVLPYLVTVKKDQSMDIGWALDFHEEVGEGAFNDSDGDPDGGTDYNVRLSTYSYDINNAHTGEESKGDKKLYLNGGPILAAPNPNDGLNDLQDAGDKFSAMHANLRLVDSDEKRDGFYSESSNNGFVNYELCTWFPNTIGTNPLPTNVLDAAGNLMDLEANRYMAHGFKISHDHDTYETHMINYYNFDCPTCIINDFKLGNQPFDVTINNSQILTENDFPGDIPPALIFFIGKFSTLDEPTERYPLDPDKNNPLETGDMYYNLTDNSYYYWEDNSWVKLGSNAPVRGKNYKFTAAADQKKFPTTANHGTHKFDPEFTIVTRAGLVLTEGDDYTTSISGSGDTRFIEQITMVEPCENLERINIFTINVCDGNFPT